MSELERVTYDGKNLLLIIDPSQYTYLYVYIKKYECFSKRDEIWEKYKLLMGLPLLHNKKTEFHTESLNIDFPSKTKESENNTYIFVHIGWMCGIKYYQILNYWLQASYLLSYWGAPGQSIIFFSPQLHSLPHFASFQ